MNHKTLFRPKAKWLFTFHFILVTVLFFSTGSYRNWPYKIESDGKYYYQYLISVWYDGDIDFANNYQHPKHSFMKIDIDHYRFSDEIVPPTGRAINLFTTGPALLWAPFFLFAYGTAHFLNSFGLTFINLDGWGLYFQYTVMYSAVIYSTLTLFLIFKLLKTYFDQSIALVTVFILFWATNWVYYSLFEVSMSHTYDLFSLVLFIWVYLKAFKNQKISTFLLAGVLAGLHALVRTQNILSIIILVGYYITWFTVYSENKRHFLVQTFQQHLFFLIMFLVSLFPLFYSNFYLFGSIVAVPQGSNFLNLLQPELYGVLLSARNGFFSHQPVLLLGVGGLVIAMFNYKKERPVLSYLVLPLLLVFLIQVYVNSATADWWAGHSFGQRRLISTFLLFGLGLAYFQKYLLIRFPKAYIAIIGLFGLFTLANLYLMLIHVFMWSYDEPHNILDWMFHRAPVMLYMYFGK